MSISDVSSEGQGGNEILQMRIFCEITEILSRHSYSYTQRDAGYFDCTVVVELTLAGHFKRKWST